MAAEYALTNNTAMRKPSRPIPVAKPKVSNIVCGMNLNCRFDLHHIALHGRNAVYNPKRFPATILRIREPKATALVFEAGKMQVLGTTSVDDAKLASRKFARILQKMGYQPRLEDWKVQNLVGSADTRMIIRLEGLHRDHADKFTRYEPELFPGLVFSIEQPKMKALVFAKGKVVFLGARQTEDLEIALQALYPVLHMYRIAG
jgi:transcription initiation factor TFIID TATA-box-binding protein